MNRLMVLWSVGLGYALLHRVFIELNTVAEHPLGCVGVKTPEDPLCLL